MSDAAGGAGGGENDPSERRAWPRVTALDPRGWVGWWDGRDFLEVEARVLDIGVGGVAVEVDRRLPDNCPVFFSIDDLSIEGVEAEVVSTQTGRKKRHLVRLVFSAPCPARLLSAAVNGPPRPPSEPEGPGEADG